MSEDHPDLTVVLLDENERLRADASLKAEWERLAGEANARWRASEDKIERLRAENAALKEKVDEVVKLLEFNGCDCTCDCDNDGHVSEDCNVCFACEVNDVLQPEFARPKPGAGT